MKLFAQELNISRITTTIAVNQSLDRLDLMLFGIGSQRNRRGSDSVENCFEMNVTFSIVTKLALPL